VSPSRYDKPIDLTELNNPHSLAVLLVRPGSTVLDVGAASGGIARELTSRGCTVYGVEIEEDAARDAEEHCARVIVGDVEKLDLRAELGDMTFDAVLLIDVLEHLVDPAATLRRCADLLAPGGVVITSLPNVAHAAVRLQLLQGSFEYSETGLLDKTHLRFFDRANVDALFADAGLNVLHQLRVTAPLEGTEIQLDWDSFAPETVAEATADPEATTFQFVTVAARAETPASPDPDATLLAVLHRQVQESTDTIAAGMAYARELETNLAAKDVWAADLEGRVASLEETLRERMAELALAHEQLHVLQLDLEVKEQYVAELRGEPRPQLRVSAQAGYLLVDRTYARLERHPRTLRVLRWVARRAAGRRRRVEE
jgi:2-polyprenyl-3-methyl-5-hydroxy-6-metoxy-1,4-benzoquinol methylase